MTSHILECDGGFRISWWEIIVLGFVKFARVIDVILKHLILNNCNIFFIKIINVTINLDWFCWGWIVQGEICYPLRVDVQDHYIILIFQDNFANIFSHIVLVYHADFGCVEFKSQNLLWFLWRWTKENDKVFLIYSNMVFLDFKWENIRIIHGNLMGKFIVLIFVYIHLQFNHFVLWVMLCWEEDSFVVSVGLNHIKIPLIIRIADILANLQIQIII